MSDVSDGGSFEESLAEAVESGQRELATLGSTVAQAIDAVNAVGLKLVRGDAAVALVDAFARTRVRFSDDLTAHLTKQSEILSTFNIAFFGRTGAGKSTLLSAFGELDGSAVSPLGEADWTETVNDVSWRGCRLFDTPGINGWGRSERRETLEDRARKAVETADVVLLCFDTQSQQASEFTKIASWVTHFGKPVVAVLNVRNARWRHPARVPNQAARRNISEPVAQHAENVRAELANIGLNDVPVVAISSKRALFARAATPYRGPAVQNFDDDRDRYGIEYLARWSNFPALESVLTACIAAGGSELRLKSLREGVRTRLVDEATSLVEFRSVVDERIAELDRLTRRYLEVLGYLEADERAQYLHDDVWHSDLLTLTESARATRYRAPSDGTLVRQVRNLLKPHLAKARNNALLRFKELERSAFNEGKTIDEETFTRSVFDDAEITSALETVCDEATQFLKRELSLADVELGRRNAGDFGKTGLDGSAGDTANLFANLLRGGGIAGGAAALVVPALLFSNPMGWAAVAAGVGIGAAAGLLNWAGGNATRQAVRQKTEARAKAAREGRSAIHSTFDTIEREFASGASVAAWIAAAPGLRPALIELITLSNLKSEIGTLTAHLQTEAAAIAPTPPLHLLDVVSKVQDARRGGGHPRAEEFLLGEDWFDHAHSHESTDQTTEFVELCDRRNTEDTGSLSRALHRAFAHPAAADVQSWLHQAAEAAKSDQAFAAVTEAAKPSTRPTVVVAGDYSAGKSSFVKRMFTEFAMEVPETLQIRADATTDEVRHYPLGGVDIVDTPGFQSRHTGHEELALAGSRDAALVIVLLHVNLLLGDTTALQAIVRGTSTAVGKWPRVLFIVNRCDELGVDPLDSTAEYFHRRDRKLAELTASLQQRAMDVAASNVHGVAADPFGGVGTQLPVTAADYAPNRQWDGIGPLVAALRTWVDDDLGQAITLTSFDAGCSALLELRELTRTDIAAYLAEAGKHDSLIAAMDICLEDADYLHRSLEHELDDLLAPFVTEAVGRIREVPTGDDLALAEALYSWRSPETVENIQRFIPTAVDKVNDWSATHASAISREEAAAGFDVSLDLPGGAEGGAGSDAVGRAAGIAGRVAGFGSQLGKVLGNRQAALKIGHFFGHKFKPWGAIKAGKTVGRVGVVFGVVAVAADAAIWANQAHRSRDWDTKRTNAIEQVESDKRDLVEQLIAEADGPWVFLTESTDQVRTLRDEYQNRQSASQETAASREIRQAVVEELVAAAEKLRKVTDDE